MLIAIDHETVYTYDEPVSYSIQSLRLTPQPFDGQVVRSWSVEAPGAGALHAFSDSFGNITHTLVIDKPHQEIRIRVKGVVDTVDANGVVTGTAEPFPPTFYLRETAQTRPDGAIRALARTAKDNSDGSVLNTLHNLMNSIRNAIDYQTGETHAMSSAIEALANGKGVCQDHAHVFIAAARSIGIPARYVSGYLLHSDDGEESEASHAWAEALIDELGWVSFDVANRVSATDRYVRVGVGLDYQEASPVRGVRRGGGEEELAVSVRVMQSGGSQQ
ncbi:MAG: transglutaminase family protein [Alphaproteobacteria bacterium]|nr:transglutaminase family protein [Alphaproteobacteria bacterium]MBF0249419.1 transglutaminase family protein [Alphaproteobacteria bacterium]